MNVNPEFKAIQDANFGPVPNVRQPNADADENLYQQLKTRYAKAVCSFGELKATPIPVRELVMGSWFKQGDLGFIYGSRGSGKTWLVDYLTASLVNGRALGNVDGWDVPKPRNVMLIDGEMPFDDFTKRLKGFEADESRLTTLHHEKLFHETGLSMNLTDKPVQRFVMETCLERDIGVLILDNLSCLFNGLQENDADSWERVLNWLLELRRRRIAVVIVHHAGLSGRMRGTTRREDSAFWVLKVEKIHDESVGSKFTTTFEKFRNNAEPEPSRDWHIVLDDATGGITISCEEMPFDARVLQLIQAGLTSATEIAEELGTSKASVSRAAKRLEEKHLISINGRSYAPRGFMR